MEFFGGFEEKKEKKKKEEARFPPRFCFRGPEKSDSGTDIQRKWWSGGRSVGSWAVKVRDGEMALAQGHNWLGREPVQNSHLAHTHSHKKVGESGLWWLKGGIRAY